MQLVVKQIIRGIGPSGVAQGYYEGYEQALAPAPTLARQRGKNRRMGAADLQANLVQLAPRPSGWPVMLHLERNHQIVEMTVINDADCRFAYSTI